MKKTLKNSAAALPGIAAALLIALVATFIESKLPIHVVGAAVMAMFMGILLNPLVIKTELFSSGIKFTSKKILKFAIILLGLSLNINTILYVGKEGIVPGTIKQASDALEAREIIKCAVQQGCPLSAREALDELCQALDAEPIQCIGRRFVMYRPSKENPRIVLE